MSLLKAVNFKNDLWYFKKKGEFDFEDKTMSNDKRLNAMTCKLSWMMASVTQLGNDWKI